MNGKFKSIPITGTLRRNPTAAGKNPLKYSKGFNEKCDSMTKFQYDCK